MKKYNQFKKYIIDTVFNLKAQNMRVWLSYLQRKKLDRLIEFEEVMFEFEKLKPYKKKSVKDYWREHKEKYPNNSVCYSSFLLRKRKKWLNYAVNTPNSGRGWARIKRKEEREYYFKNKNGKSVWYNAFVGKLLKWIPKEIAIKNQTRCKN